jgi:hypothetical protein
MANEFLEKIRTINFGENRKRKPKTTETVTDTATGYTTEHYDTDRVDVKIVPKTLELGYK